jgi:hypothetical protein
MAVSNPSMITDCFGSSEYMGLEEVAFFYDVGSLMLLVVPAAIGYALWRIFVTNRTNPPGTLILGLDANAATYTDLYGRRIPWGALSIYVLTSAVTFKVGVLAFEAYYYMQEVFFNIFTK